MDIRKKITEQIETWNVLKEKKDVAHLPVFKVGPNKKVVYILWAVLIASVLFGVYKNFTAIDKETVYQKEIVEENIKDLSAVESFVEKFAYTYHAWGNSPEEHEKRKEAIEQYMTEELIKINDGTINNDCPTSSAVGCVRIWRLEEKEEESYEVKYSVVQKFTEAVDLTKGGMEEEKELETEDKAADDRGNDAVTVEKENFYKVTVYVDEAGRMVITQNPTVCGSFEKSDYTPAEQLSDGSVDNGTVDEVEEFLNTFFNLYPTATEKELTYYVKDGVMDVIQADFIYAGLVNPSYHMEDGKVAVHVYVNYLDQQAKITQMAEYTLLMEKTDNWKIVEAK